MSDYPKHWPKSLAEARKCGAYARTTGGPCRAPCVHGRRRCRMHGGTNNGAPRGERHPNYKSGKYTKEGKELVRGLMQMARDGEALLATTLDAAGLGRKLPKVLRRRAHIRRARAAAKARKQGETK
jgi:hypothetical protein